MMSFLNEIKSRKERLKCADTVVTRADGTRYIERHSSSSNTSIVPQSPSFGFVVDERPDDVPALVLPLLYLGSQDCCGPEVLEKHEIKRVLSVGVEAPWRASGLEYTFVPCLDLAETELASVLALCNPVIERSQRDRVRLLVHCNAGVSRSATVILGYLMTCRGYFYEEALDTVRAVRPCAQPNPGFVRQLKELCQNVHPSHF